jgi:hypothetical protein
MPVPPSSLHSEDKKHRSHLPIPTPERTGLITYDARDPDTKFPPIEQGWDKLREETLARQKKLGVVPEDCQLTARATPRFRLGTKCQRP